MRLEDESPLLRITLRPEQGDCGAVVLEGPFEYELTEYIGFLSVRLGPPAAEQLYNAWDRFVREGWLFDATFEYRTGPAREYKNLILDSWGYRGRLMEVGFHCHYALGALAAATSLP